MSLPVILRPAAEADIQEAYLWLEEARPGVGDKFVDSVRDVLERVEAMPQMFGIVW